MSYSSEHVDPNLTKDFKAALRPTLNLSLRPLELLALADALEELAVETRQLAADKEVNDWAKNQVI